MRNRINEALKMVVNDTISEHQYNNSKDIIKLRDMDNGKVFANFSTTKKDNKLTVVICIIGVKISTAIDLIKESMLIEFRAKPYRELELKDYEVGIKHYALFYELENE